MLGLKHALFYRDAHLQMIQHSEIGPESFETSRKLKRMIDSGEIAMAVENIVLAR